MTNPRLTEKQIRAIRASRLTQQLLAERYAVSRSMIAQIKRRYRYGWVIDEAT